MLLLGKGTLPGQGSITIPPVITGDAAIFATPHTNTYPNKVTAMTPRNRIRL